MIIYSTLALMIACLTGTPQSLLANAPVDIVLHCDVNGTVICKDSHLHSDEVAAGELHPELLFDIIRGAKGVWEEGLPSMPFVKYIENHKYPIPLGLSDQEEAVILAHQEEEYKRIFSYLTPEQTAFWMEKHETALQKLKEMDKGGHQVFPSFVNTIQWLKAQNKSFQVLLRTYGKDAKLVMSEVNKELGEPFFDGKAHKLSYADNGDFILQRDGVDTLEKVSKTQLAACLAELGNSAVVDDYTAWHVHGEKGEWGKPFPVQKTQHAYFFDDWEGVNTIVAMFDAQTGEPCVADPIYLPPTSTFDMILNDDAMISAIRL